MNGTEKSARADEDALLPTHEDLVRAAEDKLLEVAIPWEGYQRANVITDKQLELISRYDKKGPEQRNQLLAKEGAAYAQLFLDLMVKINKDQTLQYLLTLINQAIEGSDDMVHHFLSLSSVNNTYPFEPFMMVLNRSDADWYSNAKAGAVLATLLTRAPQVDGSHVKFVCGWVREQLRHTEEKDVCNGVGVLQRLLVAKEFREAFAAEDGLHLLSSLLKFKMKNMQLSYQLLYCLWLLSYSPAVATKMNDAKLIPSLVEILRQQSRDKQVRMALATMRNLLNLSTNNEQMLDSGAMRPLENLLKKTWKDEDVVSDLQAIKDTLDKSIVTLSSYDMFKKEVLSGQLDWNSPAHRSERFWRENAARLEEENHRVLLVLKQLLGSSSPAVQSIACFDIGEFARFHPRGKQIVQQLTIKIPLMQLMESKDPEVKKHALLAVQKVMVTNWEYLSQR